VYCSNESPINVYFDNLQVTHTHGPLLEETNYYPFGLTMKGISDKAPKALPNEYKYNGIEETTDLGLNEYDAFYRNLDPQIGRWWQIDPMSDQGYENISPYASEYDNPIKYSDPLGNEGNSTHTDGAGNVLAVYNDGDLGVYKHDDAKTKSDIDQKHTATNTSAGGTKEGETEHWNEFLASGTGNPIGKIEFGQSWDETINTMHKEAMGMDLKEIADESKSSTSTRIFKFDIKANKEYAPDGPMTGKLLDGKYASARSAGNYLAGYNGRPGTLLGVSIGFDTYMKLAGALQQGQYNKINAASIVLFGHPTFGPAPWYGEIDYTGRMVKEGWDSSRK
jgi:RHS repeat-associated protein